MNPIKALSLLAVVVLLSACTVTVDPGTEASVQAIRVSGDAMVNDRLGIHGYPGATVVRQEQDRESSKTTFETRDGLDRVYDHFHQQLVGQGWSRMELEQKPNKVEAEYRDRGMELELKLQREGNSGRYRLELELDD